jgi:acetyl esterase/lipase
VVLRHRLWQCLPILATLLAGCGDGGAVDPSPSGPPAALKLASGGGQTAPAGDTLAAPLLVVVLDSADRPVPGVAVGFSAAANAGTLVSAGSETDSRGEISVRWIMGRVAGPAAATARVAGLPPLELSATVVAGSPDPSRSTISAEPAALAVDDSTAVRVVAKDRFDNPVAGAAVLLSVHGPPGALTQPAPTDAEGVAVGSFQPSAAGDATVAAEVGGVPLSDTVSISVSLEPPVIGRVTVSPDDTLLPAGASVPLTAVVRDTRGNVMSGVAVDWSSSDPGVATVGSNGVVTGRGVGNADISASASGRTGSAAITVSFGEGTRLGITYCTLDGIPDSMDVYVPGAAKPRPLPVAVHIHGGGWTSGHRSRGFWFDAITDELLDRGYLVVSLGYRFAPTYKYPAQIQDVACAMRHLRARASRYGLDPGRIGVWGASAGAQLAALLGTIDENSAIPDDGGFTAESDRAQAVVGMSTITDFTRTDELRDNYRRDFPSWPDPTSPELIQASPVTHVTSQDAPFLFVVGDADTLVLPDQSAHMDMLLRAAGVESAVLHVANADHGLTPVGAPISPDSAAVIERMADFFDRHLR